jgi:hypothetical protein
MVAFLIEGGTNRDSRSLEGHHLISPNLPVAARIQTWITTIAVGG